MQQGYSGVSGPSIPFTHRYPTENLIERSDEGMLLTIISDKKTFFEYIIQKLPALPTSGTGTSVISLA